jgi:hypothetical protein
MVSGYQINAHSGSSSLSSVQTFACDYTGQTSVEVCPAFDQPKSTNSDDYALSSVSVVLPPFLSHFVSAELTSIHPVINRIFLAYTMN